MLKTTDIVHLFIEKHVNKGDLVVDATCGNGNDTLFLANLVGNAGKVIAYDIQEVAINHAKELTKDFTNIEFHQESHEFINVTNASCVLFNLGYLPTGNKEITTKASSTISAINNLINQFDSNKNMAIYVVIYPGHEEGSKESVLIQEELQKLDNKKYLVTKIEPFNQNNAPYIMIINLKH